MGYRAAIEQIAEELCQGRETVRGNRVVEIIETCNLESATTATLDEAAGAFSEHFQTQVGVCGNQPGPNSLVNFLSSFSTPYNRPIVILRG